MYTAMTHATPHPTHPAHKLSTGGGGELFLIAVIVAIVMIVLGRNKRGH